MPLPPFEPTGDLPTGIYPATLQEIADRFGTSNGRRKILLTRLERIYRVAMETGRVARFIIFGSFITAKPEPNDIDIFLLMEDDFDAEQLTGESRWLFDHHVPMLFSVQVFSGSDALLPSEENKRQLSTGKSSAMADCVELSK